jgi:ketosteroid isomerase-like protein
MTEKGLATVRDAFSNICKQFSQGIEQGDINIILNLYHDDAKILPPNMDILENKESIRSFWNGVLEMGIKSYECEFNEIEYSGDLGLGLGKYILYDDNRNILNKGKFITVFKYSSGEWKIHRDIFNSSVPLKSE